MHRRSLCGLAIGHHCNRHRTRVVSMAVVVTSVTGVIVTGVVAVLGGRWLRSVVRCLGFFRFGRWLRIVRRRLISGRRRHLRGPRCQDQRRGQLGIAPGDPADASAIIAAPTPAPATTEMGPPRSQVT